MPSKRKGDHVADERLLVMASSLALHYFDQVENFGSTDGFDIEDISRGIAIGLGQRKCRMIEKDEAERVAMSIRMQYQHMGLDKPHVH